MSYLNFLYWMVQASTLGTLQKHEQAVAAYDRATKSQPNSYRAWAYRGWSLFQLNQEYEAIASYFKALEINPNYYKAQLWLEVILTFLIGSDIDAKLLGNEPNQSLPALLEQALILQERAIQIDSSSHNYLYQATLLKGMGRIEESLSSYCKAIEIDSNNFYAWSGWGELLEELQRYEEALTCFDKAIQIKPENKSSWNHRSGLLENLQRHEEAIAAYKKTAQLAEKLIPERVRITPKYKELFEVNGYLEVGELLEKACEYEEAIAAYRRARRIKADEHTWDNSWSGEANLLKKLERYEDLVKLCDEWNEEAESKREKYSASMYQGKVFKQLKQYEQAIAAYDRGIEVEPSYIEGWLERGDTFYELQEWQEALESYNRAIAINSNYEPAIAKREQVLKHLGQ